MISAFAFLVEDSMRRIHVAAKVHQELMERLEWALSVIGTDIPVVETRRTVTHFVSIRVSIGSSIRAAGADEI